MKLIFPRSEWDNVTLARACYPVLLTSLFPLFLLFLASWNSLPFFFKKEQQQTNRRCRNIFLFLGESDVEWVGPNTTLPIKGGRQEWRAMKKYSTTWRPAGKLSAWSLELCQGVSPAQTLLESDAPVKDYFPTLEFLSDTFTQKFVTCPLALVQSFLYLKKKKKKIRVAKNGQN